MSTQDNTELPDDVYGSADCNPTSHRRLRVSYTKSPIGDRGLLHARVGGVYLAMTERNWAALFKAITSLEIEVKPRTIKITMDDANAEAHIEVTA